MLAGLLAGCESESPVTAPPPSVAPSRAGSNPGAGNTGLSTAPVNPANPAAPVGGPLMGPDGQITVVAPPPTGQNITGQIFWVKENNIWQGGAGTPDGKPLTVKDLGGKQLTKATDLALAKSPTISPDGGKMVYAYSPEPEGSQGNIVIGQDLYLYDLKTGNNTILLKRDDPQGFLDHPVWSVDGKYLFFDSRIPRRDQAGQITGELITLYRYNLATKQREKLAEDAREPNPSPDGKQVVYTEVQTQNNYEQSLKILDLDTKKPRLLAGTDKGFQAIYFPRISPDGLSIAFSAAGGPDNTATPGSSGLQPIAPTPTKATSLLVQPSGLLSLLPSAPPRKLAARHGLPYDLWLIKTDGSGLRRLTTLYEDQPMAAWSKDGQKIALMAGQGFYMLATEGKNLLKRSDRGAHDGFDWHN